VWLLFEAGVFFSGWFERQSERDTGKDQGTPDAGYRPMSDDEMDAELDRIEADEKDRGGSR
jgi:hypothetical protein